jgi:hypothetical protein
MIWNQHHDDVGCLGGVRHGVNLQALRLCLGPALASFMQSNDHAQAGISQVQRVRMPLGAVTDDGDCLVL